VIVAKLDQLSRDVHFLFRLMTHGTPLIVEELGADADSFMRVAETRMTPAWPSARGAKWHYLQNQCAMPWAKDGIIIND
jgi:hypothetical protein